ncbi:MAG: Asp-tRNA(Asn)/Glu-tRNA(Gln) amidotransferase subunit GatA [Armatimonadetes bacterium]|nr:Asp-tRNA(Asn)/Glu-tRNA(Gln) amidotransferase subunit GatA [Armatimonadota bacterium]
MIAQLRDRLRGKQISAVEATEECLQRIAEIDGEIHAFLQVADDARAQAERADARRRDGEDAPLLGIPVALKDIISVKGMRCTCGSRILENYQAPYDATVTEKLRAAGAVIIGKTNLDEFAMGSSTENSAFGPTRNPWDPTRVPGGSSGGSAAAVAAGMVPGAYGTDTGGSIRQPAAFCGVTGIKPTYGRVSRYGVVAYASSLDQVGPFGRTARDCAILLGAVAGEDPRDATSAPLPAEDFEASLEGDVTGLRIGIPREFTEGLDPAIRAHVEAAAETLQQAGATVENVSLPTLAYALPAYYIIAPAEASSNLARYDGARYGYRAAADDVLSMFKASRHDGFGAEVKRRIMIGTYALSAGYYDAYYLQAQRTRTLLRRDFERAFETCDVLLGPAAPTTAFRIGEKTDDPLQMYLADVYTIAVNLAGLPGMVIPGGMEKGLPVGLQWIGPAFTEARLLNIGHAYQQLTRHHQVQPR